MNATLHLLQGDLPDVEGFDGELSVENMRRLLGEITALRDQNAGLSRTINSQAGTIGKLQRDREAEAKADPLYPVAQVLHAHWSEVCRHPKAKFDVADFEQCRPMLKRHGEAMCRRAIDGAAFDCFTDQRRNGSTRRHDSWELIFRNPSKFMEFANRAPRGRA